MAPRNTNGAVVTNAEGSFLTDEQRLLFEKALSDKRRDDELRGDVPPPVVRKNSKPSVLDIDPWASGGLMFLRRPKWTAGGAPDASGAGGARVDDIPKQQAQRRGSLDHDKSSGGHHHRNGNGAHTPKRHGHGSLRSKGFWKGLVSSPESNLYLDEKDPNYDAATAAVFSEYELQPQASLDRPGAFKTVVSEHLREYLSSGDMVEFKCSVEEMEASDLHPLLVKRAITLGLDGGLREREMVSQLLSFLYPQCLSSHQMQEGFASTLDAADDILIDHPREGKEALALFVARAIVDDVLPRNFPDKESSRGKEGDGKEENVGAGGENRRGILAAARVHVAARHAGERLLRCWGSGAGRDVDATKRSMGTLLSEYLASGDWEEASFNLQRLHVPFFHHELVKQALVKAIEDHSGRTPEAMMALLSRLATKQQTTSTSDGDPLGAIEGTGLVSAHQMHAGFTRVSARLGDLELDVPQAKAHFQRMSMRALSIGLLRTAPSYGERRAELACDLSHRGLEGEEGGVSVDKTQAVEAFRAKATGVLSEFFVSGDHAELEARLGEVVGGGSEDGRVGRLAWVAKRAMTAAMDRRPRDKEEVSRVLSDALPAWGSVGRKALELAFTTLLSTLEDLALDVPDAPAQTALFLARAVVDEAVEPAYVGRAIVESEAASAALESLTYAAQMLAARHACERLSRCWGPASLGGGMDLDATKKTIRALLTEYKQSGDIQEASSCLKSIGLPFFHHEAVKQALVMALEAREGGGMAAAAGETTRDALMGLLLRWSESGLVSPEQMQAGFQRCQDGVDDLALDCPGAKEGLETLAAAARDQGWLT